MSQIGLNHRLTVANTLRQQTRALYEGVLGATPRPDTEIFTFATVPGSACSMLTPGLALTPEQHLKAI